MTFAVLWICHCSSFNWAQNKVLVSQWKPVSGLWHLDEALPSVAHLMTSLQLLGWEQSSPCVGSFFFFCKNIHHSLIFLLQTRWVKVCITCCHPGFTAVMDSSSLEKDCLLTAFHTQMCLTKRCTCNISSDFLFCYFCSIKLAKCKTHPKSRHISNS